MMGKITPLFISKYLFFAIVHLMILSYLCTQFLNIKIGMI